MIRSNHSGGKSTFNVTRRVVIGAAGALMSLMSCISLAANCSNLPVSGKTYTLLNEGSGLYLDVAGKDTKDGADVIQWTSTGGTNQQWTLADLGGGAWSIRPVHSNKSLDVYNWSNADKTPIKQWGYSGQDNQRWNLNTTANGGIKIVSVFSKLPLAVPDSNKNSKLMQLTDSTSAYQRWYFNPVDGVCASSKTGLGTSFMGSNKVLIGSINSGTAQTAPFDIQYQYINNLAPDAACMTSCKAVLTAPAKCGDWWGCWQWVENPPGTQYPGDFIKNLGALNYQNQPHPQLTYWTYYSMRFLVGGAEGQKEMDAINDAAQLTRYFADYRFFLQKIGSNKTIVHIEPDLWGFIRNTNRDPHTIPAKVNESNPDCPAQTHENSVSGFARCMITMAHKYAPNAAVGLHASPWNYQTAGDAQVVAKFMNALSAGEGDFIATDPSDRDAGYYDTQSQPWHWWTSQSFAAYLAWSKGLSEAVGKPTIMWQIPIGNSQQNNTQYHYKDNKGELLFGNIQAVADAHVVGLLFGAGNWDQTGIDTDSNVLINETINNWKAGSATIK
jgi:hypothetical protein